MPGCINFMDVFQHFNVALSSPRGCFGLPVAAAFFFPFGLPGKNRGRKESRAMEGEMGGVTCKCRERGGVTFERKERREVKT